MAAGRLRRTWSVVIFSSQSDEGSARSPGSAAAMSASSGTSRPRFRQLARANVKTAAVSWRIRQVRADMPDGAAARTGGKSHAHSGESEKAGDLIRNRGDSTEDNGFIAGRPCGDVPTPGNGRAGGVTVRDLSRISCLAGGRR